MSGSRRVSEATSDATLTAASLSDHGLDARAAVPEAGAILADLADRADRARRSLDHALGIAYADGGDAWLDIYRPAGAGPHPVLVHFHGESDGPNGARESAYLAPAMAERGILTVCVNHGSPSATSVAARFDRCRRAAAWIRAEIGRYGGDPGRLALCGYAEGAHLAAMVGAADTGRPPPVMTLLVSGLFDLATVPASDPAWRGLDPRLIAALSPVRHPPSPATEVVLTCGEYESEAAKRQTDVFFRVCAEAGCRTRYVSAPRRNHFDIALDLADPHSTLVQAVATTIGRA